MREAYRSPPSSAEIKNMWRHHIPSWLAQGLYVVLSRTGYCVRPEFDTVDIFNALELCAWVDRLVMLSLPLQDYKWGSIAVCALIKLVDGLTL